MDPIKTIKLRWLQGALHDITYELSRSQFSRFAPQAWQPAINAYRRLGYAEHTRFEERLIHRLGSPWPDVTASLRRLFTRKETDPR